MNRMSKESKQGWFDYATTCPGSPRAAQFAGPSASIIPTAAGGNSLPSVSAIPDTPTFSDFSVTWRKEMAPQWRRQHRNSVDAPFDAHLIAEFGERPVGSITKADVLDFRARLAESTERPRPPLHPPTINRTLGLITPRPTTATK